MSIYIVTQNFICRLLISDGLFWVITDFIPARILIKSTPFYSASYVTVRAAEPEMTLNIVASDITHAALPTWTRTYWRCLPVGANANYWFNFNMRERYYKDEELNVRLIWRWCCVKRQIEAEWIDRRAKADSARWPSQSAINESRQPKMPQRSIIRNLAKKPLT